MNQAFDVLNALEALGANLWAENGEVRLRYPERSRDAVQQLKEQLRANRPAVIQLLHDRQAKHRWPKICVESAFKFDRPYACLFPLIEKRVQTPQGTGTLKQVLGPELVRVALDRDPNRMTDFRWEEVFPLEI